MGSSVVLGLSCDYHDAAAALLVDGQIAAAVEQERLSRSKHDADLPERAIASCLAIAGVGADDVETVAYYEKPMRVISRNLAARQSRGFGAVRSFVREFPVLLGRNLMIGHRIDQAMRTLGATRTLPVVYGEHHVSHASAAFYPSPFAAAAILTVDGVGEWSTATIGHGANHRIEQLVEQRYPASLGLLYTLATAWCGFTPNDGEYKLMGLAPFGEPRYVDALRELVEVSADGSLRVDARALGWWSSSPRSLRRVGELLDGPPRHEDETIDQRHADIASSVQQLTEEALLAMAHHAHVLTGEQHLCLGGGVSLNAVANGRLAREGPFKKIWVQPAAGDAGSALGAALWWWHQEQGHQRSPEGSDTATGAMAGTFLGPRFEPDAIHRWLSDQHVPHRRLDAQALADHVAERLAAGAVVGWFQGRMEFGPRALGNRSILADARSPDAQRILNERIKGRESFRPFAPAVLAERAAEWFQLDAPLPHMTVVVPLQPERLLTVGPEPGDLRARVAVARSEIPACTHVDGSARVQTVHADLHPLLHRLLQAFEVRTGCPVLVNTSFNRAGEPIVATPDHALDTARRAGLDLLVLEDCVIELSGPPFDGPEAP